MKNLLLAAAVVLSLVSCGKKTPAVEAMKQQLDQLIAGQSTIDQRLVRFDTLDFVVYSRQEWTRLHESHSEQIKVTYPDGHTTVGLPDHVAELKKMFVFAPDTHITQHPIAFGSGNYTAVTGLIEGTFTNPMPMPDGSFLKPTGKKFALPMATVGIWEGDVMIEEHLFYDNLAFMQQIGAL